MVQERRSVYAREGAICETLVLMEMLYLRGINVNIRCVILSYTFAICCYLRKLDKVYGGSFCIISGNSMGIYNYFKMKRLMKNLLSFPVQEHGLSVLWFKSSRTLFSFPSHKSWTSLSWCFFRSILFFHYILCVICIY